MRYFGGGNVLDVGFPNIHGQEAIAEAVGFGAYDADGQGVTAGFGLMRRFFFAGKWL